MPFVLAGKHAAIWSKPNDATGLNDVATTNATGSWQYATANGCWKSATKFSNGLYAGWPSRRSQSATVAKSKSVSFHSTTTTTTATTSATTAILSTTRHAK